MTTVQQAAQIIFDARKTRSTVPRLPEALRPQDPESALAIQDEVTRMLGREATAWKCALPRPGRIGIAPIFDVYRQSPVSVISGGGRKLAEPEIAFVLGRDMPQRAEPYTDAEIRAAIAEARLVIEVIGPRLSDIEATGFTEKMADHVMNEALFVGPPMTAPIDEKLAGFPVTVTGPRGAIHTLQGRHPDGNPFLPFAWLVNYLASKGKGLKTGGIVTTGSYIGFVPVPVGVDLKFSYGNIGSLEVRFTARD
jgi:2-keto-4-pentenoate hydratase